MSKPSPLPINLAPRGLSREEAAAYIGIGTTKFDAMVADGRMPQPKSIDSRRVWDRLRLDSAFAALPDATGICDTADDIWNRVAV
jgi:predicted DNA-binding transcriptional regulator AlpA